MTTDKERYDRDARLWTNVMMWCVLGATVSFFALIAVLNMVGTPLPGWIGVAFVPVVAFTVGIAVSRYIANSARANAAVASAQGAADAVRALADEIEEFQREKGDRKD